VATPIEQQINGVDNMDYMYSLNATANSQTTMIVDFDVKTDQIRTSSSRSRANSWPPVSFRPKLTRLGSRSESQ